MKLDGLKLCTCAACSFIFTGCASIVSDSSYAVNICSTPSDASFTIKDNSGIVIHRGTTPERVELDAGNGFFTGARYSVEFQKSNYAPVSVDMRPDVDPWYFGNLIFGGIIGLALIDPVTGAMWELPENVHVNLSGDVPELPEAQYIASASDREPEPEPVFDVEQEEEILVKDLTENVDEDIPVNPQNRSRNIFVAIIANENYRFVGSVDFARNDGRIFYEYCRKTLGIPESQIRLSTDATLGEMMETVAWLEKRGKLKDSELVLYYSGHGLPDEKSGTAYLLPTDVSPSNLSYVRSLNSFYEQLSSSRAKVVTVFLDACFSGMRRDDAPIVAAKGVRRAIPSGDISKLPPNIVVFAAASGDQTAHFAREQKHGLFTYKLLEKIKETRGKVSFEELSRHLNESVLEYSLKIGDFEQTPMTLAHDAFPHWGRMLYADRNE